MIRKDSYTVPAIFDLLAKKGQVEEKVMYNTYNMGIGMVIGVSPEDTDKAIRLLEEAGEKAYVIGETKAGEAGVTLC